MALNRDFSDEFEFNTSRSGGAGGQHVNKVSSKVELRFHVENSKHLSEEEKLLIKEKLANRINNEGYLRLVSQAERSQLMNKERVVKRFHELVEKALTPQIKRRPTKIPRRVKEERLQEKKKIAEKKEMRKKNF